MFVKWGELRGFPILGWWRLSGTQVFHFHWSYLAGSSAAAHRPAGRQERAGLAHCFITFCSLVGKSSENKNVFLCHCNQNTLKGVSIAKILYLSQEKLETIFGLLHMTGLPYWDKQELLAGEPRCCSESASPSLLRFCPWKPRFCAEPLLPGRLRVWSAWRSRSEIQLCYFPALSLILVICTIGKVTLNFKVL